MLPSYNFCGRDFIIYWNTYLASAQMSLLFRNKLIICMKRPVAPASACMPDGDPFETREPPVGVPVRWSGGYLVLHDSPLDYSVVDMMCKWSSAMTAGVIALR